MDAMTPLEIAPSELKARLESGDSLRLIDVREPHEFAHCRLAAAELIPMQTIPRHLAALKQGTLVLYCHHGIRSLQAARWLRGQGVPACQSLQGGIDAWSREVDPQVPRY
jgi:adenylyltransferase/sulfurtransferase